ncbi:MAG: transporter substrate-binding domain-containing protein, partial [Oscillospiraceae bacterium]
QGFITMATSPDFGPYEFMDLNKEGQEAIVGAEIKLGKYIADYLGVDLKIESMDFDTCQASVSVGKVDMSLSGYAKTDERAENMNCSDFYYWKKGEIDTQGVMILKENEDKLNTKEAFKGKTLAAQNGSLQLNLVTKQLPDSKLETISSINDGVMLLLSNKVDGLASSGDTGLQFCKNYPELAMSKFCFDYNEDGNILLVPKGEDALMAEINKAIKKAADEGMYEKWLQESTALCDTLGIKVN